MELQFFALNRAAQFWRNAISIHPDVANLAIQFCCSNRSGYRDMAFFLIFSSLFKEFEKKITEIEIIHHLAERSQDTL